MKFLNNLEIAKLVKIDFTTDSDEVRSFYWDNINKTTSLEMGGGVVQQVGRELYYSLVRNNTASAIINGTPVMITGIDAEGYYTIAPANANSGFDYVGLVTETIPVGEIGNVTFFGEVSDLDTSSFRVGDILWVDPVIDGGLTVDKPVSPSRSILVGIVKTVDATNGVIAVRYTYLPTASEVTYDNTTSGLESSNVQSALDELQLSKASVSLLSSNIIIYPTTASSDVTGYNRMVTTTTDPDYDTVAVDISTGVISTNDQLCGQLIADPGLFVGNPGVVNITTLGNIAKISGNSTQYAEFYFSVYSRDTNDVETLVATSATTGAVNPSDSNYHEFSATAVLNNGEWLSSDRVVIKYYANLLGNTGSSYYFQFGGTYPVRTNIPVPVSVLSVSSATGITTETSTFNGILSDTDTNVQAALNTIDDHTHDDMYVPITGGSFLGPVNGRDLSTDGAKLDTIEEGAEVNVQSDWTQANTEDDSYILNKPYIPTSGTDFDPVGTDNSTNVTVTDSSEIDFTLTGQNLTATLVDGSISASRLDSGVNASLDLADSALQSETLTSLVFTEGLNTLTYTDENNVVHDINLSVYLDDTNLSRLVSGTYVTDEPEIGDKSLKFIRDDDSVFYIDASMFFDDTNLVTSVNGQTGAVTITIPSNFTDLSDTPSTYTDHAYDLVSVNATGDGLEFIPNIQYSTTIMLEEFTSIEGQLEFILTGGEYVTGRNRLALYIWGTRQNSNSFIETASDRFTLAGTVPTGTKILAEYFIADPQLKGDPGTNIASEILLVDNGSYFAIDNIEDALQEIGSALANLSTEAIDTTITDVGNYFTSTNVEAALQEIGYTLSNLSADAVDITITDTGNYFTSTDVEGALQEVGYTLSNLSADAESISLADTNGYFTVDNVEAGMSQLYEQDLFLSDDAVTWTDTQALAFITATDDQLSDIFVINNANRLDGHPATDFAFSEFTYTKTEVDDLIINLIDAAPEALNTLNELSTALNDDENFATTVTNALAEKAPLESPTFTGTVSGITKAMVSLGNVDNTSDVNKPISTATQTALDGKLSLTGGTLTGALNGTTITTSGAIKNGSLQMIGGTVEEYSYNGISAVSFNFNGYNNGTTQFRNIDIYDGKQSRYTSFNGETKTLDLIGGRLKFPATQNPSSDANTLDDYEEGTWTMTLNGTTPSSFTGYYTKVGRLVYCYCYTGAMTSTSVEAIISGLPFTANATFPVIHTTHNNWTSSTAQSGYINSGSNSGIITNNGTPGQMATALAGTTYMMLNVVYQTY